MNAHLNDEQWAEALAGAPASEAREHFVTCSECAARQKGLAAALAGFGEAARAAAQRPEGFWAWQRDAIAARLAERNSTRGRAAWASAIVLLALAAVLLLQQPPAQPVAAQKDPDQELLVEVERSVGREVPESLEPALLLTQELNQAAEKKASP